MKALEDITVVDLSRMQGGLSASLRLADLGARVISIVPREGSGSSGPLLNAPSLPGAAPWGIGATGRNKERFEADLSTEGGRMAVHQLIKQADVVLHDLPADFMKDSGLDYDSIRQVNERVVYGEVSGFGPEGPWKDLPVSDLLVQSLSGLTWLSGNAGDGPVPMGLPVSELLAGTHLVQGLLACLVKRGISGTGGLVQVSLMESVMDLQFEVLTTFYNDGGALPERTATNNAHAYLGAPYGIYSTGNGWIALSMASIPELGRLLNCPGLLFYEDASQAFTKRDDIKALLTEHLLTGSTEHWLSMLEPADIWCASVLTWEELMRQEGFRVLDMLQEAVSTGGNTFTTTRCPIRIDGEWLTSTQPPHVPEQNNPVIAGTFIGATA